MASGGWQGSDRRSRLPENWPSLRKDTLKRDGYRCTHVHSNGKRCSGKATDVDHKVPGDDHSPENLQSLCSWHHRRKSATEGANASNAKRREIQNRLRRVETHPGLLS